MPDASAPAVEATDLVTRYGATTALDGLSLSLPSGVVSALLGPNGAGKTTLVETCEGYRSPDSGLVRVLGLDPQVDGRALRPRVGVMLQQGGVYPGVPALEMLRHVAALHGDPLPVGPLAERLGIAGTGRTPYRRLSGGEQQRLALALAVVGRPELVFLDEPTAGMDPQARHATWDLVRELVADGVTVVLTTHFMEEAERLADHVAVVDRGRVVATGSPRELMAGGDGASLRFRAVPGLDLHALTVEVDGLSRADEVAPGQYVLQGRVDARLLAEVATWCAARDVLAEGLTVGHRSLEDVFLELTGTQLRR